MQQVGKLVAGKIRHPEATFEHRSFSLGSRHAGDQHIGKGKWWWPISHFDVFVGSRSHAADDPHLPFEDARVEGDFSQLEHGGVQSIAARHRNVHRVEVVAVDIGRFAAHPHPDECALQDFVHG